MSLYEPAHQSISTWDARYFLFHFIREIAPEVLEDLRREPFNLYHIAAAMHYWHQRPDENELSRLWDVFESEIGERDPSVLVLRHSLMQWSEKYNLKQQWCLEKAFKTIDFWYRHPPSANSLMWNRDVIGYIPPVGIEEGKFMFTFPTWDSCSQSRSDYQRKVEKAFRQYRIDYCDRIEQLTQERDYVEQKRKRDKIHFLWLAWYQVKGKPQSWICNEFHAARPTVAEAIKGAAAMCGLILRQPTAAGRPRKSES